jgi:chromosome partitioning protein
MSRTQVIGVLAHKGGVGKTTTVVTLADLLALAEYRVLVVDLDVQGNVGECLGLENDNGLFRFLVAEAGKGAIQTTRRGFDVMLGGVKTVKVKRDLVNTPSYERPEMRLRAALAEIHFDYDVIFLDTAPGVDELQIAAMAAADGVLVPVDLSELAVKGAIKVIKLLDTLKQREVFLGRLLGILPTKWERVSRESKYQLRAMRDSGLVCWPPVPQDVKVKEAQRAGQTLVEYNHGMRALCGVNLNGSGVVGGYARVAKKLMREVLR